MRTSPDAGAECAGTSAAELRVLVAVHGSAGVRRVGEYLARLLPRGSTVRVVVVLPFERYPFSLVGGVLSDEAERTRIADETVGITTAEVMPALQAGGIDASVAARFGYAPDRILDEVESFGPDLLVMGRRGLHAPARWFESVSEHVLHRTEVPVLMIHSGSGSQAEGSQAERTG